MTIPKECKRLAEVDFPIAVVSKHAVREKSAPRGHPSMLHLWWARRPLASSRAMLMALLLPDPADPNCPPAFREQARAVLLAHHGRPAGWDVLLGDDEGLRKGLLKFIGDFANWDYAADPQWLKTARDLVKAAYPEETPLVVDPFAGGGSIPLEALRIGCDAFASDVNPVAVLINKVMLEDIPRYGKTKIKITKNDGSEVDANGLAEALRIAGAEVKAVAERELQTIYPLDPDGSQPIAYIWARTVRCEAPNCGAEIPLIRSFWLAKTGNRKRALRYNVDRVLGHVPQLKLEIFEPSSGEEVPPRTVSRARAMCPCCHMVLTPDRVRAQLTEQHGGAGISFAESGLVQGARLLAVVCVRPGTPGRQFRLATERDLELLRNASERLGELIVAFQHTGSDVLPTEPTPVGGGSGASRAFSVRKYGISQWSDLFTDRQLLSLLTYVPLIERFGSGNSALKSLLAAAFDRVAMSNMSLTRWNAVGEKMQHTFGRQALPIVWDFAEVVPTAAAPGNWQSGYELVADVVEIWPKDSSLGQAQQADAGASPLVDETADVWFTDPPYYDAVPYADLSDFFFVWLKRLLSDLPFLRDPFDPTNALTPKQQEAVQDETRLVDGKPKDRSFFELMMANAFAEGRRILRDEAIGCVVFAHKTTEGWEALLTGLVESRWTITGSWPIATEMATRLRARDSAALATSVHLIGRARPSDAPIADWGTVFRELPVRVSTWMDRLESEGIRGADLVFACIGPALEIYSQYSQVVDAEDRPIPLGGDPSAVEPHSRGYFAYVWETVARLALQRVLGTAEAGARDGAVGVLEEDARLTALFLWTLQATDAEDLPATPAEDDEPAAEEAEEDDESAGAAKKRKGGLSLPFDVARRFAQPLGIHLPVWEGRIIDTDKGVVQLLPVGERARQLFGADGADAVAGELERSPLKARDLQLGLFAEQPAAAAPARGRRSAMADEDLGFAPGSTTLDRLHAAMLLQKSGRTNALRALLAAEQERGPVFLRLANALSGLYPKQSEEKRLVDAMLLLYPK